MPSNDDLSALVSALAGLDEPATWAQAAELGLMSIGIPEDAGGSGGTLSDLLVVVEQFASNAVSTPIIEASTARWVLAQCQRNVSSIGLPTLILHPNRWATDSGSRAITVPWGRSCERVVVVAEDDAVFEVMTSQADIEQGSNVAGEQRDTLFVRAGEAVTRAGAVNVERVRARIGLLWCAAVLGAAKGAYRLTKAHVGDRQQFGANLTAIPAVASQLAMMKTDILQIQTAFDRATSIVDDRTMPPDDQLAAVAVGRIIASACAGEVARTAHQLHGAIGTTDEHPLQRYTRRLWAWRDGEDLGREWERLLGRKALGGEQMVWDTLSAPYQSDAPY